MHRLIFRNQGKNLFRKKANVGLFLRQKPGASRDSPANRNILSTTFKLPATALSQK